MEKFIFVYSLSYATDISQNYICLPHPHYIHHAKYIQNLGKPMIYVMIGSDNKYDNAQMHKLTGNLRKLTGNFAC